MAYRGLERHAQLDARRWPMVNPGVTALLSVAVVAVAAYALLMRRRPPAWVCGLVVAAALVTLAEMLWRWGPCFDRVTDRAVALEVGAGGHPRRQP